MVQLHGRHLVDQAVLAEEAAELTEQKAMAEREGVASQRHQVQTLERQEKMELTEMLSQ
jgi:hypothetical protein